MPRRRSETGIRDHRVRESLSRHLRETLKTTHARNLYRRRRVIEGAHGTEVVADGRRCSNFCSNDYLGLAAHPALARAMADAAERNGTGSGASQLITGHNAEHAALEAELADVTGCERALVFVTGYAANMGVIEALMGRGDTIVADALNHASLIDGARLSGAAKRIYAHADADAAAETLAAAPDGHRLLLSDTVFSMDGDVAPLAGLARAADTHDAWLMVDDAHGFAVRDAFAPQTRFESRVSDFEPEASAMPASASPDIYVATLGKAIGAAGAFVAGDNDLIEYLIQRARTLIFSTAPPPAVAAAARAGLHLARTETRRREHLHALIRRFRTGAEQLGLPIGEPRGPAPGQHETPIQPLILGDESSALAASEALLERGHLVSAIRPPTVLAGTSRLRITLTAGHDERQVDELLDALAETVVPTQAATAR